MSRLWKWLAAAGGVLVAVLAGLWAVVNWKQWKDRLQHDVEEAEEDEAEQLTRAQAELARESGRGQAALAESQRQVAERARDGAGAERLHRRLSPPGRDP